MWLRQGRSFLALAILFFLGCSGEQPLDGFDAGRWKASLERCDQYRLETVSLVLDQKEKILGLSQKELKNLLGTYTSQRLLERNQKIIFYDLDCDHSQTLSFRFDALGRIHEIRLLNNQ